MADLFLALVYACNYECKYVLMNWVSVKCIIATYICILAI